MYYPPLSNQGEKMDCRCLFKKSFLVVCLAVTTAFSNDKFMPVRCKNNWDNLSMEIEVQVEVKSNLSNTQTDYKNYIQTEFVQAENKLNIQHSTYELRDKERKIISKNKYLWDSERWFSYHEPQKLKSGFGGHSRNKNYFDTILANGEYGSVLEGYLCVDKTTFYEMLQDHNSSNIASEKETVDGHDCLKLELRNEYGHYLVWIDPEFDNCIRKAKVTKNKGNVYAGTFLGDESLPYDLPVKVEFILEDVKIDKIGDFVIPTHGKMKMINYYKSGKKFTEERFIKRSNIIFNQDLPENTFLMDMPKGTKVWDKDVNVYYRWNGPNSQLTAWVDENVLKAIDKELGIFESEGKQDEAEIITTSKKVSYTHDSKPETKSSGEVHAPANVKPHKINKNKFIYLSPALLAIVTVSFMFIRKKNVKK